MTSFKLTLTTTDASDNNTTSHVIAEFRPDPEKKSAFWIENTCIVASPAHAYMDCYNQQPFFLGGFQLISNARTVEVYLKKDETPETYLTTCRGVPVNGNYKIVCVIPGGPRLTQQAHLKLLTKDEPKLNIVSLKVTARIPDEVHQPLAVPSVTSSSSSSSASAAAPAASKHNHESHSTTKTTACSSSPPPPPLLNDWNNAIAGLAFLMRSTFEKHELKWQAMEHHQHSLESRILQPLYQQVTEQSLIVSKQNEQTQQQTRLILQQQEMIQALTLQIQVLASQQQTLVDRLVLSEVSGSQVDGHGHDDDDDDDLESSQIETHRLDDSLPTPTDVNTKEDDEFSNEKDEDRIEDSDPKEAQEDDGGFVAVETEEFEGSDDCDGLLVS